MTNPPTWLVPGESVLRFTADKSLFLTTHRIRRESGQGDLARFDSIRLDRVTSCAIGPRKGRTLGSLGFGTFVFGLVGGLREWQIIAGVALGLVLLFAQIVSGGPGLRIVSEGGEIEVEVPRGEFNDGVAFINAIDEALLTSSE